MTNQSAPRKGGAFPSCVYRSGGEPVTVGNRTVGFVFADTGDWYRDTRGHILQRPPAIGYDLAALEEAERLGARFAYNMYDGAVYAAPIAQIRAEGFEIDRGYGKQIMLALPRWIVYRPDGEIRKPAPLVTAEQMDLFGEVADGRWASPMPGVYWGTPR